MDNLGAILGPLAAIVLVGTVGTRWAIGLSVIPGLLAAVAVAYAIRHTTTPRRQERRPLRIRIRAVLTPARRRLFAGITAFELGNCAATLLILRATELLRPGHGADGATTNHSWAYRQLRFPSRLIESGAFAQTPQSARLSRTDRRRTVGRRTMAVIAMARLSAGLEAVVLEAQG